MDAQQRQQLLLETLTRHGSVLVASAAAEYGVSANTIRNDLNFLADKGLARRTYGGAVLPESEPAPGSNGSCASEPLFRKRPVRGALQEIATAAAALVEDGDAIALDGSDLAFHLACGLQARRNLTVLTNGLDIALLLAQNPTNKVLLAAQEVSYDGQTVVGRFNSDVSQGFYVSRLFVSCGGCTVGQGFTDSDVDVAGIKSQMVPLAREVVALVESGRFGRTCTCRFAGLADAHRVITDNGLSAEYSRMLREAGDLTLTVAQGARTYSLPPIKTGPTKPRYRIGFANLSEHMIFPQVVRQGLERAALRQGNVDLLVRDNDLSREAALENIDWFIREKMDLVIEYQLDAGLNNVIMDRLNQAGLPAIAVDIPMPGATFFGVDNYRAGFLAGQGLGEWVTRHWGGQVDLLLELRSPDIGAIANARLQGARAGLESVIGPLADDVVQDWGTDITREGSIRYMLNRIPQLSRDIRIGIVAQNDDMALASLDAFEKLGRLKQIAVVGQGADPLGRAEFKSSRPFVGTTRYAPEYYGDRLIELGLRILKGESVPPAIYCRHVFLTRENLHQYYPEGIASGLLDRSPAAVEFAAPTIR
jgi:ribose transport system substrate-binding protein